MPLPRAQRVLRLTATVALPLLGAALALFLLSDPRPAQAGGKIVGDGTAGSCNETNLRAALAGGGTITFNCSAAPNPIILSSEIVITALTVIDGTNGGHPITISGGGETRIFRVGSAAWLTMLELTIRDGAVDVGHGGAIVNEGILYVSNTSFISNTTSIFGEGGAIASYGVVVVLENTEFADNHAGTGGAIYLNGPSTITILDSRFHHNTARQGGAISAQPGTTLKVDNSEIDNNQTLYFAGEGQGAGIRSRGNLTVTASAIHNNFAQTSQSGSRGGGIYHEGGQLGLIEVDFVNNRATRGGGVFMLSGTGNFTDLSFEQNRAESGAGGGLLIAGGTVALTGAAFDRNIASTFGGAIDNTGTLTLADAALTRNTSSFGGGGIANWGALYFLTGTVSANTAAGSGTGDGGGIRNQGTVEAYHVTLLGNVAHYDGGGIYNSGLLALGNAAVLNNVAEGGDEVGDTPRGGGGLYNSGFADIEDTLFARNRTLDFDGGGIFNDKGLVSLIDSTLADNTAADDGGGLVNDRGTAGAINVTFSGNTASGWGGGVLSDHGETQLSFSTLAGNSAAAGGGLYNLTVYPTATVYVEASLFAGNGSGLNCDQFAGSLNVQSGGYNLSDDGSFDPVTGGCPAFGLTDLVNPAPLLGPLSYGLGPTPVRPLLPGSPAIDVIPIDVPDGEECGTDLEFDQRGIARPTEGDGSGPARCDIGAFEHVLGEKPFRLWLPFIRR